MLEVWFLRGLLYIFVGCIAFTVDLDEKGLGPPNVDIDQTGSAKQWNVVHNWALGIQAVASATIIGCGTIYSMMGVTCRKQVDTLPILRRTPMLLPSLSGLNSVDL